ncbi:MAG: hypothetical protein FWE38_03825 [Firmicutes bacterium]|nr:hypothetical protein [Bacillota bacterium]
MKTLFLNLGSVDPRVAELKKLAMAEGTRVYDVMRGCLSCRPVKNPIAFFEPKFVDLNRALRRLPRGTVAFGFTADVEPLPHIKYINLMDDPEFTMENNYLTALAMKQIIGDGAKNILIIGYGKLCSQLERVFDDISILDFNPKKQIEIKRKYGDRAYFQYAALSKFNIIINTIPAPMVGEGLLRTLLFGGGGDTVIYDLASAPYGFDWGKLDRTRFDYRIEPALPGRYFPRDAAVAVKKAMERI